MSRIEINPLSKNRVQHTKIGLCRVAYPQSGQWRSAGRARAIPLANESEVRHIDLLEPRARGTDGPEAPNVLADSYDATSSQTFFTFP